MRTIWALGVVTLALGCSSSSKVAAVGSRAEVTVTAIVPVASSELSSASDLDATISYHIDDFEPAPVEYYLTIQFDKTGGGSFNHYHRFAEEPLLSLADGTVHVTYAMAHVWNDQRLKKPIQVWFYIVERTAQHDSTVIGKAGPIDYANK